MFEILAPQEVLERWRPGPQLLPLRVGPHLLTMYNVHTALCLECLWELYHWTREPPLPHWADVPVLRPIALVAPLNVRLNCGVTGCGGDALASWAYLAYPPEHLLWRTLQEFPVHVQHFFLQRIQMTLTNLETGDDLRYRPYHWYTIQDYLEEYDPRPEARG